MKKEQVGILFVLAFTSFAFTRAKGQAQKVDYIAHRGASYLAPENSISSNLLAWKLGADAVEIDVRLTSDNRIVLIHDSNTKRVSGVDLSVSQTTIPVLQQLDIGKWKSDEYIGEKIPLLADVLPLIPKGKRLYIEIKSNEKILPYLKKIIDDSGKSEQITIICFNLEVLKQSKQQLPKIPVFWLLGTEKDRETKQSVPHDPDWLNIAKENQIDALDVHYAGINEDFMMAVKNAGQELYVWTVDDPRIAAELIRMGVKGVTTNRPAWLKQSVQ